MSGLTGNFVEGVFFTEEAGAAFRVQQAPVQVKIKRQNANLPELKKLLARKVRQAGGNALVGFSYGQRRTLFGWDNVAWEGSGYPAVVEDLPAT